MPTNEERVVIVISAKDEATKAMKGIGAGITTAIGTFAGGAALGIATKGFDALWGAVQGGVSDARDAAQVFAQTQAVIKSTGGAAGFTAEQIADMAGSLSAASGKSLFGDDDIQRGQNMLLTFTNIKETLPDTTQVMLDMAQALGTDAGGAAVQLGKALNDPIQGISALSRVGVSFTDQQKEQIKAMQEAGDMAGAQQLILAELNKEFGGSAQAAATADGGMAQLQDTIGELAESIGAALLPLIQDLLKWLTSPDIQAAIATIGEGLVGAIGAAIGAFGEVMTVLQPVVAFVRENLTAVLAALATMLAVVVVPAFIAWATSATAAATATIVALAPVLVPIAAIGAAVGLLVTAWDRDWGGMRTTLTAWWTVTVQPILKEVWTWIGETLPKVFDALSTAWHVAWDAMAGAITTAKRVISGVIGTITSAIQGTIDVLNILIDTINKIPGVHIPTIPSLPGASGTAAAVGLIAPMPAGLARSGGVAMPAQRITINVDARGATDPFDVEQAGYRGARRAMREMTSGPGGRRSVANLRTALDSIGQAI